MISLFENNRGMNHLKVYLLGEGVTRENRLLLKEISDKYKREIEVINTPKIDIPESLVSARWPLSAYTRIFAGTLLPESLERVLYLDCDTIVCGDISEIDNINISDKTIWGVKDCIGKRYKKNIGLREGYDYINAGVLLMNLSRLRGIDIHKKINQFMNRYKELVNYADQDVLNGCFCGDVGIIAPRYNVMTIVAVYSYKDILRLRRPTHYYSEDEILNAKSNPYIIHYTTNMTTIRPWFSNSDHPYVKEFRKYLLASPWNQMILSNMVFASGETKIINMVKCLPNQISIHVLGYLHSVIKPQYIMTKRYILKRFKR